MLKLKSAHFGSRPDFVDVNVRRLTGNMNEKHFQMTQKLQKIEQINEQMDDIKLSSPHISLQELQEQQPMLWQMLVDVMEGDWSLNPHQ